jgi:hypothetical protein
MKNSIKILGIAIIMASNIMINACKGDIGDVGPAVATGAKGETGPAGTTGPRGETGTAGTNGTNGKDGATGATGAMGATGSRGETGATGAQGPKGDAGTADVFYSNWISVQFIGSTEFAATINAPKITQEILDKGTVLTYAKSNLNGNVIPLPFAALNGTIRTTVVYNLGKVLLGANFNASSQTYRYIIFSPGISIGAGRKKALESMSYEEVKALYNIPA